MMLTKLDVASLVRPDCFSVFHCGGTLENRKMWSGLARPQYCSGDNYLVTIATNLLRLGMFN